MFIEKLTKDDVRAFLTQNINMDIEEIEFHNGFIYVRLGFESLLDGHSNIVEYHFKDFSIEGQNIFAKAGEDIVQPKWIAFMEQKFDKIKVNPKKNKQYTKARLEYLRGGREQ